MRPVYVRIRFKLQRGQQLKFALGARGYCVAQMQSCTHLRTMAPTRISKRKHILKRDRNNAVLIEMRGSIELIELGESNGLRDMPL